MKKFLTVLLALLRLCGSCLAEGLDYASMTDAQLHDIVDAARNELTKRELVAEGKTLLFEQDGVFAGDDLDARACVLAEKGGHGLGHDPGRNRRQRADADRRPLAGTLLRH